MLNEEWLILVTEIWGYCIMWRGSSDMPGRQLSWGDLALEAV